MAMLLHDADVRRSFDARLARLQPSSSPAWGKMTVGQMLWHVGQGLEVALGRVHPPVDRAPLPRPVLKFIVLRLPWPKGAPTNPVFRATEPQDFAAQMDRCRRLIAEFTSRPIEHCGRRHPFFGEMSGPEQSRLQAKHVDHHLRQFKV